MSIPHLMYTTLSYSIAAVPDSPTRLRDRTSHFGPWMLISPNRRVIQAHAQDRICSAYLCRSHFLDVIVRRGTVRFWWRDILACAEVWWGDRELRVNSAGSAAEIPRILSNLAAAPKF